MNMIINYLSSKMVDDSWLDPPRPESRTLAHVRAEEPCMAEVFVFGTAVAFPMAT